MGFFGLALDGDTLLVAPIIIGIAVDDTIHFLTTIGRNVPTRPHSHSDSTICQGGRSSHLLYHYYTGNRFYGVPDVLPQRAAKFRHDKCNRNQCGSTGRFATVARYVLIVQSRLSSAQKSQTPEPSLG